LIWGSSGQNVSSARSVPSTLARAPNDRVPIDDRVLADDSRLSVTSVVAALPAPAPGRSPDLAFGFTVGPLSGYRVDPDFIGREAQAAMVRSTAAVNQRNGRTVIDRDAAPALNGRLRLFYSGAFDPSTVTHTDPVQVGGRQGYYAKIDGNPYALAWEYAAGGWAVVSLDVPALPASVRTRIVSAVKADELRIAAAVGPATNPLHVPFAITPGISGYVDSVNTPVPDIQGGDQGSVVFTDASTKRSWPVLWSPSSLQVADGQNAAEINGRTWLINQDLNKSQSVVDNIGLPGTGAALVQKGFTLIITNGGATSAVQVDAVTYVIQQIRIASNPSDPASWFPASEALP
jgi:hypothetical protein